MAEAEKLGTVTPLNSLFTSEEAEKAARRVEEAKADSQKELSRLRDFISDNSALIHHVQKLPDELSYDIMVPFGGAAFFPGRLIHTNEFLVLLGEGYYAERSAKQTAEILQRRGKSLEAHVESLSKIMKDLEVEARFFDSTAAEVAEGLVEIREEYVDETHGMEPETDLSNTSFIKSSKAHDFGFPDEEEDEDAKIMAKLDELEKEEEEAASDLGDNEVDETASSSEVDEFEDDENVSYSKVDEDEDDEEEDDDDEDGESEDEDDEEEKDEDKYVNDHTKNISETDVEVLVSKATGPGTFFPTSTQHNAIGLLQHSFDQSSTSSSKMQVAPEGSLKSIVEQPHITHPPLKPPETREYLQKPPSSNIQAFTGRVIEHSYGLSPAKPSNNSTSGQPSRPVSRFKLRKGNP